jgi:hypothetical protein
MNNIQGVGIATLLVAHILRAVDESYSERPSLDNGLVGLAFVQDHRIEQHDRRGWYMILTVDGEWGNERWNSIHRNEFRCNGESLHRWAAALDIKNEKFKCTEKEVLLHAELLLDAIRHGDYDVQYSKEDIERLERVAANDDLPTNGDEGSGGIANSTINPSCGTDEAPTE